MKFRCMCPQCGVEFVATFTDEDLNDGCTPTSVWCPSCIDRACEGLTKSDVEFAVATKGVVQ